MGVAESMYAHIVVGNMTLLFVVCWQKPCVHSVVKGVAVCRPEAREQCHGGHLVQSSQEQRLSCRHAQASSGAHLLVLVF